MGVLDGRVACITGGSRGIGRGIAEAFLREGAHVVITGRDPAKAQRTLDELGAGDAAHFVQGDVTKRDDCEGAIAATVEHFGKIDILVPNAGGGTDYAPVAQLTDESMAFGLTYNFWHTFWTMRAAFGHMIPQGFGRVMAISSVEGKVGKPGISPYVVTALACTSSTSPTSSGSVPGRACLPSALWGSGACSSWYWIGVHPDQVPSVRVRTMTLIWSSASWVP